MSDFYEEYLTRRDAGEVGAWETERDPDDEIFQLVESDNHADELGIRPDGSIAAFGEPDWDESAEERRLALVRPVVAVVFDVESGPTPVPLGTFVSVDEEAVVYRTADDKQGVAPSDCVLVVNVEVPLR